MNGQKAKPCLIIIDFQDKYSVKEPWNSLIPGFTNGIWIYYLASVFGSFFGIFYYEFFLVEGEKKYYHRLNLKFNEDSVTTMDRSEIKSDFNYLDKLQTFENLNDEDNAKLAEELTY